MAKDPPDKHHKTLYCSFCTKSQHEVKKLIAGPNVFICDECIDLANDIIRDEDSTSKTPTGSGQDLTPEEIAAKLGDYVIGQLNARMKLAVAVYDHYVRINNIGKTGDVEIEKSNILMIGPTGSGKTLLAQTLARILNVPFTIADATKITAAGYVGEDVETMLQKLLANADYDVKKAERGIIYIDEIDKIARSGDGGMRATRDVGGEEVQYGLLKILEGTIANVPPAGGRKSPSQEFIQFDTANILFIVGGAFSGLAQLIGKRIDNRGGIGFGAAIKGAEANKPDAYLHSVEPEDLIKFGLVPELVGRLQILATLDELSEADLVRVLTEPKNALVKQFSWMIARQKAELTITPEAALAIAKLAKSKGTGGRGLRTILENVLLSTRFVLPGLQRGPKPVKRIVVGEGVITKNEQPLLLYE